MSRWLHFNVINRSFWLPIIVPFFFPDVRVNFSTCALVNRLFSQRIKIYWAFSSLFFRRQPTSKLDAIKKKKQLKRHSCHTNSWANFSEAFYYIYMMMCWQFDCHRLIRNVPLIFTCHFKVRILVIHSNVVYNWLAYIRKTQYILIIYVAWLNHTYNRYVCLR